MDLRELRKIQRDTGFNPGFIEKVYQLTRILEAVYSDNNLKEYLALKGGTALNFIYLNIPRLSVDLDFNFVGALEKNKMLQLRPTVTDRIKVVADNLGFTTSKKPFSYILDRFLLRYRSLQGLRDSIRIEINYLERIPVVVPVQKSFHHFFGDIERFKVKTYQPEELGAMKTKALVERLYARDLYDIYNISQLDLQNQIMRKLMLLYILMANQQPELQSIIRKIAQYNERHFMQQINPFISSSQNIDAFQMKQDVVEFYKKILALDGNDKKFLENIKQKVIDMELLFGGNIFNPEATAHPSLLFALEKR